MPISAISAAGRSRRPGSVLVLPALALNYLGQAALGPEEPGGARQSLLPAGPDLGADPDGGARHDRHHHRQPGGDHGRLFPDAPGDPARPAAAHEDRPYLRGPVGPDLHPAGQRPSARRRHSPGSRLREFVAPRRRLRHRGDDDHGGHRDHGLHRHLEGLALDAARGGPDHRALPCHRPRLPRRQPSQGARRRMGAADARCARSSSS